MKPIPLHFLAFSTLLLPILQSSPSWAQAGQSEQACLQELSAMQQRVNARQDAFTTAELRQAQALLQVGDAHCRQGDMSFMSLSNEARTLKNKLEQAEASAAGSPRGETR